MFCASHSTTKTNVHIKRACVPDFGKVSTTDVAKHSAASRSSQGSSISQTATQRSTTLPRRGDMPATLGVETIPPSQSGPSEFESALLPSTTKPQSLRHVKRFSLTPRTNSSSNSLMVATKDQCPVPPSHALEPRRRPGVVPLPAAPTVLEERDREIWRTNPKDPSSPPVVIPTMPVLQPRFQWKGLESFICEPSSHPFQSTPPREQRPPHASSPSLSSEDDYYLPSTPSDSHVSLDSVWDSVRKAKERSMAAQPSKIKSLELHQRSPTPPPLQTRTFEPSQPHKEPTKLQKGKS